MTGNAFLVYKQLYVLQTLDELHFCSQFCHLDIKPANIMVLHDRTKWWDTVRLIDFGFARSFNKGIYFP